MRNSYRETVRKAIGQLDKLIQERLEQYNNSSEYFVPKDLLSVLELRKNLVEINIQQEIVDELTAGENH